MTCAATVCGFSLAFGQAEIEGQQPGAAQPDQPGLQQDRQQQQQPGIQEEDQPAREFGERPRRDRPEIRAGMPGRHAESFKASELEGSRVEDRAGERLGTVDSLAVNLDTGELNFIVVSSGGFLGIGSELKLVPPDAVEVQREEGVIMGGLVLRLDIDEAQWEQAPSVEDREEIAQFAQADRGREVYRHYGIEWEQRAATEFGARDRQDREFGVRDRQDEDQDRIDIQQDRDLDSPGIQQNDRQQQPEFGARQDRDKEEREYGVRDRDKDKEKDEDEEREFGARAERNGELKLSTDLQGTELRDQQGEEIGRIDDLLADVRNGQISFVLISTARGFWEMGEDDVYAIAPQALQPGEEDTMTVNISRQQLEQAQRLTQAQIQEHVRRHAMEPERARTQPQVFRFDADDETIFGRPERQREAPGERDRDRDEGIFQRDTEEDREPTQPRTAPGRSPGQEQRPGQPY